MNVIETEDKIFIFENLFDEIETGVDSYWVNFFVLNFKIKKKILNYTII